MMLNKKKLKIKKLNKGVLIIEFLFVFVVSLLFVIYFFLLSMTFVQIEVAQYIAFSTSRQYFLGNQNLNLQRRYAEIKFNELTTEDTDKRLLLEAPSWWDLTLAEISSNIYSTGEEDVGLFEGVLLNFTAKVIRIQIPFLRGSSGDVDFQISSSLGREPTIEECQSFFRQKKNFIVRAGRNYPASIDSSSMKNTGDNGC